MKTLIVTSLLALSASTAMAADAVYETPAPPVAQETLPVFTWSGPYLGIQGGAAVSYTHLTLPTTPYV